jgi:putative ABC transport system permease protein
MKVNSTMIKNLFKTAFRSLKKNKGFTALNVLGLALGLTAFLLIVLYVVDELSYDRYNTKADRIYRVNEDLKLGNNSVQYAVCMPPLAQTLKADFPDIEDIVRLKKAGSFRIKKNGQTILEDNNVYADPSIFNVFTLPVTAGDVHTALKEPNSIVLTETTAKKYFNRTDVVGQTLTFNDDNTYKITGVMRDMPAQSHFKADFLISMSSVKDARVLQWLRSNYNTYILFKKGANPQKLQAAFPAFLRKYSTSELEKALHLNYEQFEKSGSYFRLNLIKLADIHLHSAMNGELDKNGNIQYVYIFSVIALFTLLIACVNFMNLSTARSSSRAREVGVRKVLGASRKYLIAQFLTESILVTTLAAIIACVCAKLLLPFFNDLARKEIIVNIQTLTWLLPTILSIVLVIGVLAGSYPAFFLSGFQPIQVLKGKLSIGFNGSWLRSLLVVFQFFVSIVLIVGTIVIYNQLSYIQTRDLGYNRNQVMIVKNVFVLGNQTKIFKQQIKQLPGVINATTTGFLPTTTNRNTSIFYKEATQDQKNAIFPQVWYVDNDYVSTLGMKIVAGRNFSSQMATDSVGIIINQTAAGFLGYKDPLGKILYKSEVDQNNITHLTAYHVVGMVKDFNFTSLHENIKPVTMLLGHDDGSLAIRFNVANLPALLPQIKEIWNKLSPGNFEYSFMDADFDRSYRTEQHTGLIFMIFSVLAIVIACLGLFGLAAYAAEQRTKEIGVRKVLGAGVYDIVAMLSKNFIGLVMVSIVIATPVAWWVMQSWLRDFAYRVSIHWWVFGIAGSTAVLIALVTISFQSIKAAIANPVKSLRNE